MATKDLQIIKYVQWSNIFFQIQVNGLRYLLKFAIFVAVQKYTIINGFIASGYRMYYATVDQFSAPIVVQSKISVYVEWNTIVDQINVFKYNTIAIVA